MTSFVDTSALVKVYVPEAGARTVRRHLGPFVLSALTRVEVVSAFFGKWRTGEIAQRDAEQLAGAFEADLATGTCATGQILVRLPVDDELLGAAIRNVARHGLRAYDAMQLATAQRSRAVDPSCTDFLTFDHALARAAQGEGFTARP